LAEEADERRAQRGASAAEEFHPEQEASAEAECRPQQEVLAEEESPALGLQEAEASEVVDPAPQASRYSDSLFRQPRFLSFLS